MLAARGFKSAAGRQDDASPAQLAGRRWLIGVAIAAPVYWMFTKALAINLPGLTATRGGCDGRMMDIWNQLLQGFMPPPAPRSTCCGRWWAAPSAPRWACCPGIGPATAVAMLLPITLKVEPTASR